MINKSIKCVCLAAEEGVGLPAPAVRGFRAAFDAKLEEVGQQLEAMKGRHRGAEDALGRELDRVTGELSGAAELAALKEDLKRASLSCSLRRADAAIFV